MSSQQDDREFYNGYWWRYNWTEYYDDSTSRWISVDESGQSQTATSSNYAGMGAQSTMTATTPAQNQVSYSMTPAITPQQVSYSYGMNSTAGNTLGVPDPGQNALSMFGNMNMQQPSSSASTYAPQQTWLCVAKPRSLKPIKLTDAAVGGADYWKTADPNNYEGKMIRAFVGMAKKLKVKK